MVWPEGWWRKTPWTPRTIKAIFRSKKNLELQPFFPQIKKRNKKNWPWPWEPKKNEKTRVTFSEFFLRCCCLIWAAKKEFTFLVKHLGRKKGQVHKQTKQGVFESIERWEKTSECPAGSSTIFFFDLRMNLQCMIHLYMIFDYKCCWVIGKGKKKKLPWFFFLKKNQDFHQTNKQEGKIRMRWTNLNERYYRD